MSNCALLQTGLSQIGIKEIYGKEDNPEVLKYFYEIGFDGSKLKDETSWCSAFINWVAKTSGHEFTGKLNARSWLGIGEIITFPQMGDVVIFWREKKDSWKGHVGLFIREYSGWIWTLGGNQSDMVKISAYPKGRLLGYRRLNIINQYKKIKYSG